MTAKKLQETGSWRKRQEIGTLAESLEVSAVLFKNYMQEKDFKSAMKAWKFLNNEMNQLKKLMK